MYLRFIKIHCLITSIYFFGLEKVKVLPLSEELIKRSIPFVEMSEINSFALEVTMTFSPEVIVPFSSPLCTIVLIFSASNRLKGAYPLLKFCSGL